MDIEDKRFKEALPALQHIALSAEEKSGIRAKLVEHMRRNPIRPRGGSSFVLFFMRPLVGGVLVLLVLASGAGAASVAAERSLPGDALYPLKTEVNEPVVGFFKSASLLAKVLFEWGLFEKRLIEAERLAEDRLTGRKEAIRESAYKHKTKAETLARKLVARENARSGALETMRASAPAPAPQSEMRRQARMEENDMKIANEETLLAQKSSLLLGVTPTEDGKEESSSTPASVSGTAASSTPQPTSDEKKAKRKKMLTETEQKVLENMNNIFERHERILKKLDLSFPAPDAAGLFESPDSSKD